MTERARHAYTDTKVQPVTVQGCPRQNVCSFHSLIGVGGGRAGEKLCKMFTSEIFAMNASQTET